jgi:UDP-N-acetyl-D-galactosamine dehydrogenase
MNESNSICVVGLGYVGLPLAVAFAEKFNVIGYDVDLSRIAELKKCQDKTLEVESSLLHSVQSNISYTSRIKTTKDCNIYIITVPTPVDSSNRPNLKALIESSKMVGSVLKNKNIVIYESTVFPGVTEDVCVPELESESGLKFNKDFFCGYSPERINPGDKKHTVTKIKKVTSGSTPLVAKKVDDLYKQIIEAGTHMAPSIKVAEASKVVENTQRDVNLALINEVALICDHLGIDTNEVIEAASTKWNFIKLKPGLVGGHCIGVDPYYLSFKAEQVGYQANLILTARQINNGMSKYVADKTVEEMIKVGTKIKGSNVLVLGVTFKEDCPDMRNTKVIDIIEELTSVGLLVDVYDPWANYEKEYKWYKYGIIGNPFQSDKKYDAIVVAVAHKIFKAYKNDDFQKISSEKIVLIDVKNIVDSPTWRL